MHQVSPFGENGVLTNVKKKFKMQNCTDITICEFLMESQVRVLSVVCWHLTVGIVLSCPELHCGQCHVQELHCGDCHVEVSSNALAADSLTRYFKGKAAKI